MSTRANIIVKDSHGDELIFYRHSDGYPDGAMPTLEKFIRYVKENRIRDNVGQAAGWLILLGRQEYATEIEGEYGEGYRREKPHNGEKGLIGYGGKDWKIGAIEPTTNLHSDIQYLYVIDLDKKEISHCKVGHDAKYNATVPADFYNGKFNDT